MTVARFWAAQGSEIIIRPPNSGGVGGKKGRGKGGGGWTGRGGKGRGGGGSGGGPAGITQSVVEAIAISSGVSIDITTIDGIAVSEFSMITGALWNVPMSGSPTEWGIRLSKDGGTSYDSATTHYRKSYVSGNEVVDFTVEDKLLMHSGLAATGNEAMFILWSMNVAAPMIFESAEMSPRTTGAQKAHYGHHQEAVEKDAFQIIVTGGSTPLMTGGTLYLQGFY